MLWKVPLILLLVSFAVWWQLKQEFPQTRVEKSSHAMAPAAALAGHWSAEVTYSSGDKRREQFWFQPEGDKLFGTASYLAIKRGIEEGKIEGEKFSFVVNLTDAAGGTVQQHRILYRGVHAQGEIHMWLQDGRGNSPVEFVLRRDG